MAWPGAQASIMMELACGMQHAPPPATHLQDAKGKDGL